MYQQDDGWWNASFVRYALLSSRCLWNDVCCPRRRVWLIWLVRIQVFAHAMSRGTKIARPARISCLAAMSTTAHDPITAHKGPRPTHFLYWVVRRNFTTDTSKLQHWHCRILVATTLLMTDAMCNLAQASMHQGSCGNGRRTDCTGLYVFFNFWIRVLAKIALYEKITRRTFVCSYWITDFTHARTRASPPVKLYRLFEKGWRGETGAFTVGRVSRILLPDQNVTMHEGLPHGTVYFYFWKTWFSVVIIALQSSNPSVFSISPK